MHGTHDFASILLHPYSIAHHNVEAAIIGTLHRRTIEIDGNVIIAVQEGYILALCRLHARKPSSKKAAIAFVPQDAESAIPGGVFLHDADRPVRRGVVHQDELRIAQRLPAEGIQALPQIFFRAIHRHNDG